MKKSLVVSWLATRFPALAFKGDFKMNLEKVVEFGYDGIEIAIRYPKIFEMDKVKDMVDSHNLIVPAIGTGQAYLEEGLSLSHPEKGVREKTVRRLLDHIRLAKVFNSQVIFGMIKGRTEEGMSKEETLRLTKESINACAEFAQKEGVNITLEPLNRYETDLLNNIDETLDFISDLGYENIYITLDIFHMNIEEASIEESIKKTGNLLSHFHIADSNRCAPGFGHLDFSKILKALKEIDYQGFISAEILPRPDPDTAAKKAIEYIKEIEEKI